MALINTLRNKMGKVVVAFIAVAIFAFILADLLGSGSGLFNNDNQIGEIAGEDISLQEFQQVVKQRENSYTFENNRQPSERDRPTLRQQAWELLVVKYAFQKQYDKVGIEVTTDEVWDIIQGKNQDPRVRQFFTNPETGQFDRELFLNFINNLERQEPVYQNYWYVLKSNLKPARERLKYENLILESNYVTTAEAERAYHNENDIAEIEYLFVPFYAVSDSAVNVTEDQLQAYYDEHKEKYKTDHTRTFEYVSFPIIPSSTDTAFVKEEMQELQEDFKTTDRDSIFAGTHTGMVTDPFYSQFNAESLPAQLKANISNLSVGDVRGPYLTSNGYVLYKVSDIFEDTTAEEGGTAYKIATIRRRILPGDETRNEVYREADLFSSSSDDLQSFEKFAKEEKHNIRSSGELEKDSRRVNGLGEAREVVQWLFRDASIGEVSEVFELENQYVVAVMTEETEEGYESLNAVKPTITAKVKEELKGQQIIKALEGSSGSLEEIATAFGNDANVYTSSDLKFAANSLPHLKDASTAVGKAFSLEESGQRTEPFSSEENGVVIIELQNKTIAPEIADYSAYQNLLQQRLNSMMGFKITNAIKEHAEIEDYRYKFY